MADSCSEQRRKRKYLLKSPPPPSPPSKLAGATHTNTREDVLTDFSNQLLVCIGQYDDKFEEMNGIEPSMSYPLASSSGSNGNPPLAEMANVVNSEEMEIETQGQQDANTMSSDLNIPQDDSGGIMMIVPSEVGNEGDYWFTSDVDISITDMWKSDCILSKCLFFSGFLVQDEIVVLV
ncbi:hypothetical protein LguiA_024345 [Lonicera macranthoides]